MSDPLKFVNYFDYSLAPSKIDLGTSGTPQTLTAGTPLQTLYSTCSSTSTSTAAEPFYMKSTMTGAAGIGGRARFHLYTNVALGSYSNALKGYTEYGASGRTTGLGSAVCAEILLSAGTSSGTYAPLESEIVINTNGLTGTATSFLYCNATGTAASTFDTNGFLFQLGAGMTAASGKILYNNTIRVKVGSTTWYLPLSSAEGSYTTAYPITSSNTTAGLIVSGAATDGISITGACTDGFHISGNCTYPIHLTGTIDSGVGIYAVHSQVNACYSGIWYEIASTQTGDDFSVIRGIGTSNSASSGNQIRVIRGQAKCGASKYAALLEGGSFEADYSAGSCTVTRVCALAAHISQGASLTSCTNLYVAHLRAQTRGDESISTDDDIVYLENEAVGGNGRQMDTFVKCAGTNLGGSTKAAGYLIDGGISTDLLGTAFLRLPDDQTICSNDNQAILVDISGTTNDGFIKVVIGTETKYIALYDTKTS